MAGRMAESSRGWMRGGHREGRAGDPCSRIGAGKVVPAVVGGLRGQHLRHLPGVRRLPAGRDPRPARRFGGRVGARGCGPRRGRLAGGPARPLGGTAPQAARAGRDGPAPLRCVAERSVRLRRPPAHARAAPDRLGDRHGRDHHVPGRQRLLPQDDRAPRAAAGGEHAVRVHDLAEHPGRAAARRGRHRRVRSGRHDRRRWRQLPALGGGDRRDPNRGARSGGTGRANGPRRGAARRVALHPRPRRAPPPVPEHRRGQRSDHGRGAPPGRADARAAGVLPLAVRARLRGAEHRGRARGPCLAAPRRAPRPPEGDAVVRGGSARRGGRSGRAAARHAPAAAPSATPDAARARRSGGRRPARRAPSARRWR
jgi:hypothetical protein